MPRHIRLFAALVLLVGLGGASPEMEYWAVRLGDGVNADRIAQQAGAINLGQIGAIDGAYLLATRAGERHFSEELDDIPGVAWYARQEPQQRTLRDPLDPAYPDQWHLRNTGQTGGAAGADLNINPAWDAGYTGEGVVIGVVEGGIDAAHPDLAPNFLPEFSLSTDEPITGHATGVAGLAAAAADGVVCGVGTAYGANFTSLSYGLQTDAEEAAALSHALAEHDIYSSSWGPFDTGSVLDGPGPLTLAAIEAGLSEGRGGLGVIYVWAAGNGRQAADDVNADGYAALPGTITVASTDHNGQQTAYSERGAAILVNAPSSAFEDETSNEFNGLPTTLPGEGCASVGGTSAGAPTAAGVIALMLEANPTLTWRDVQHILVETAATNDPQSQTWFTNAAGYDVSHDYGHGRIDAAAAVEAAENWAPVPELTRIELPAQEVLQPISDDGEAVTLDLSIDETGLDLEHVELVVNARHQRRGDLRFELVSPSGTLSTLLFERPNDTAAGSLDAWRMMTTHFWGEPSDGVWSLRVTDAQGEASGILEDWQIVLYGTSTAETSIPTSLTALAEGQGEVVLAWNGPEDAVYRVEASTDFGAAWDVLAETSERTFRHEGLEPCSTFTYRVQVIEPVPSSFTPDKTVTTAGCEGVLLNPSFEEPLPGTWVLRSTGRGDGRYRIDSVYEGSYVLLLSANGALETLSQVIEVDGLAGQEAVFTFWMGGRNISQVGVIAARVTLLSEGETLASETCTIDERGSISLREVTCSIRADESFDAVEVGIGWVRVTSGRFGVDAARFEILDDRSGGS